MNFVSKDVAHGTIKRRLKIMLDRELKNLREWRNENGVEDCPLEYVDLSNDYFGYFREPHNFLNEQLALRRKEWEKIKSLKD